MIQPGTARDLDGAPVTLPATPTTPPPTLPPPHIPKIDTNRDPLPPYVTSTQPYTDEDTDITDPDYDKDDYTNTLSTTTLFSGEQHDNDKYNDNGNELAARDATHKLHPEDVILAFLWTTRLNDE